MKVQFELVIGQSKFTLVEDVENNADFFKKMSFYSQLPSVGPNGETDLVLQHRVAQKQYDYYSIVSKKANQEFKFGQSKEQKGALFAKGWEPLYQGADDNEAQTDAAAGIGAPQGFQAPQPSTPLPAAGIGSFQAPMPTPAAAPRAAAPAPAPAAAAPPQVNTQAAAILSKFGI